jgi:hypothetical protein
LTTKKSNKRGAKSRVSQNKSPQQNQLLQTPIFAPVYKFNRTLETTFDVSADGVNPTLLAFQFKLSDLPGYTEFTQLFSMYKFEKIQIEWTPEYTELTDASALSNAQNVRFNSAIILTDAAAPASVNELLQSQSLHATGITKQHKREWRPTILLGSTAPASVWLSRNLPSENHFGIKIAIPPCGTAMVFRSRVKYWISFANPV